MKLPIEVRDRTVGNMLSILINGNDVATLSHDQADELANKLLEVTCRLREAPRYEYSKVAGRMMLQPPGPYAPPTQEEIMSMEVKTSE